MPQILADFTSLWRGAAQPADLDVDASYWLFIRNSYSGLAALRGIDLWVQNPFAADGSPVLVPEANMLTWVNGNVWRGECPGCQRSGPLRRNRTVTICLNCWGVEPGGDTVRWFNVEWPADVAQAERQLLKRVNPQHRNWHRQLTPGETLQTLIDEDVARGIL